MDDGTAPMWGIGGNESQPQQVPSMSATLSDTE